MIFDGESLAPKMLSLTLTFEPITSDLLMSNYNKFH